MKGRFKKPRPLFRRERTFRDDRLFVVATEDTYAPEQYFWIFKNPRIKVRVLPTECGLSSPAHVFERINEFKSEYDLTEGDELWLMLDTDCWTEPNHVATFDKVCREAIQKEIKLAHSNPCFEIWLLLHLTDLEPNERFPRCSDVENRLRAILGSYNKSSLDSEQFRASSRIEIAIKRAKELDLSSADRWPQRPGTHVYRIVEKLMVERCP